MSASSASTSQSAPASNSASTSGSGSAPASSSTPSSTVSYSTVTEPLTTIYTPPAWCKERLWTSASSTNGTLILSHSVAKNSACYPPLYGGQTEYMAYSPGVCPQGWTAQASWTNSAVTTSICCPSSMVPLENSECGSWVNPPATIALNAYQNTTLAAPAFAFEFYIEAIWASSDLSVFTPHSAPLFTAGAVSSTSSASPSARPSHPASSTSSATSTPHSGGGSLTTGEKAGIGVGAGVGGLMLIGALIFLFLWIRRRKDHIPPTAEISTYPDESHHSASPNPPYDSRGSYGYAAPQDTRYGYGPQDTSQSYGYSPPQSNAQPYGYAGNGNQQSYGYAPMTQMQGPIVR